MNGELSEKINKLLLLRERLNKRINELKSEYGIDNDNRKKDFYEKLEEKYEDICDTLEKINRIDQQLQEDEINFKSSLGTSEEEEAKKKYEQDYDLLLKYVNDVYKKYEKIMDSNFELKERFRLNNKTKIGLSAVALLAVLGIGGFAIKNNMDKIKNSNTNVDDKGIGSNSSSQTEDPTKNQELPGGAYIPEQEPVKEETLEFIDINDEEQVATRANEVLNYFNEIVPNQNMTIEKTEEFLKYINGGVVNDPSYDGAAFVIDTINNLMAVEIAPSVDILNNVQTSREKKDILVDYSKFFIDGSQGQKLAKQITNLRQSMIINASGDISKYRKEFTELFMNSWILHGFDGQTINAYTLEEPGMEALIDLMFLNTSTLVGESSEMVITNPLTLEDITLEEIHAIANYEECPMTLVDEEGNELQEKITLDKSSADLYAMYTHAMINKRDYEDNFGKTLTK